MKKRFACAFAGIFSAGLLMLTGCGQTETAYAPEDKAAFYQEQTDSIMQELFTLSDSDCEQKESYYTELENDTLVSMYQAWANENDALGTYQGIGETAVYESDDSGDYAKSYACEITYLFSTRNLDVKVIYETEENDEVNADISSISLSGEYSVAEKMQKAGLNTLMGMGTVFIVLILITCIISLFGPLNKLILKVEEKKKAKEEKQAPKTAPVSPAPAPAPAEEELLDDMELVAVITAAIAAYEEANGTAVSADGLVVRSIRRVNKKNNWRNA